MLKYTEAWLPTHGVCKVRNPGTLETHSVIPTLQLKLQSMRTQRESERETEGGSTLRVYRIMILLIIFMSFMGIVLSLWLHLLCMQERWFLRMNRT